MAKRASDFANSLSEPSERGLPGGAPVAILAAHAPPAPSRPPAGAARDHDEFPDQALGSVLALPERRRAILMQTLEALVRENFRAGAAARRSCAAFT
jgi:hypothetical protein